MSLKALRHVAPLLILICGLISFVAFCITHNMNFGFVRSHRIMLAQLVFARPIASAIVFWSSFAALEACGAPVGVPLMIMSGFLFGTFEGVALSVLAATTGAVATFLAAKSALARFVSNSSGRLREVQEGFRRNAFIFLLFTRLLPFFPFFLVNFVAGTFDIALGPFIVASLVGLVPAAYIYASLGGGLNELFLAGSQPKLDVLYEPHILIPLIGLACLTFLPLLMRRRRKP